MDTSYIVQLKPLDGDGLSIVNSSDGITRNVRFDGKDCPSVGSGVDMLSSARRTDERTITLTDKIAGKIVDTQEITVSADTKPLTMTVHVPGRTDPNVLTFDRQ